MKGTDFVRSPLDYTLFQSVSSPYDIISSRFHRDLLIKADDVIFSSVRQKKRKLVHLSLLSSEIKLQLQIVSMVSPPLALPISFSFSNFFICDYTKNKNKLSYSYGLVLLNRSSQISKYYWRTNSSCYHMLLSSPLIEKK